MKRLITNILITSLTCFLLTLSALATTITAPTETVRGRFTVEITATEVESNF